MLFNIVQSNFWRSVYLNTYETSSILNLASYYQENFCIITDNCTVHHQNKQVQVFIYATALIKMMTAHLLYIS